MKNRILKTVLTLVLTLSMVAGISLQAQAQQQGPTQKYFEHKGNAVDGYIFTCDGGESFLDWTNEDKTDDIIPAGTETYLDTEDFEFILHLDSEENIIAAEGYKFRYDTRLVEAYYYGDDAKQGGRWHLILLSIIPPKGNHTHNYEWSTIVDPTTEQDGVEAYICDCGDIQATQPISAAHHILKVNADKVKNAKAGATVVVELGRLNSLPRWFVTKLVERDDLNVTLKITYKNENYSLEIPKTAKIEDESIEWYGPLKLMSMFPQK